MDVDKKNGKNLTLEMEENYQKEDKNGLERGLFIPVIKNETKQERANRILSMMEESNDRLNRVLEIFNRISR